MYIIPHKIERKEKFRLQACSYEARQKFRDAEWGELAAILRYYGIHEIRFEDECSLGYSLVVNFDNASERCKVYRVRLVSDNEVEIEVMLSHDDDSPHPYLLNRIDLPLGEVGSLAEYLIDSFEEMWCRNIISK